MTHGRTQGHTDRQTYISTSRAAPSQLKILDVVEEPFPDLEQVLFADGELGDVDVLVLQPQLHHEDDDDSAVSSIP